jgi:hypothetical protein
MGDKKSEVKKEEKTPKKPRGGLQKPKDYFD